MAIPLNKRIRQYIISLLALVILIFYILVLVGCLSTSPGIPGIYLVTYSDNSTQAQVRVGLFGLCAGIGSGTSNLTCSATIGKNLTLAATNASAATATLALPGTTSAAPAALQSMLRLASSVQTNASVGPGAVVSVIFVPIVLGSVAFVVALGALLAHHALEGRALAAGAAVSEEFYEEEGKYGASPNSVRAWHIVRAATTYSLALVVSGGIAVTAAGRALLYSGTQLPGAAVAANAKNSIVVKEGTTLPVLLWMVVGMTVTWHLLMQYLWKRS